MAMQSENPFSPDFGRPPVFYGRSRYVKTVTDALLPGIRANRSILIEGIRGTGKTALLCHLRDVAEERGWEAIYVTSVDASSAICHDLAALEGKDRRLSGASLEVFGIGGSVTLDKREGRAWKPGVRYALLDHMRETKAKGLIILIDEMQKIAMEDAQDICDAIVAARTYRDDVALVMAGLPGTLRRIDSFPKCTYMARSTTLWLSTLTQEEARAAFASLIGMVPEVAMTEDSIDSVADFTKGHPYLLQLVGYNLYQSVERVLEGSAGSGDSVDVTQDMIDEAEEAAYANYSAKVLDLLFRNVGPGMMEYLRAIAMTMDRNGVMESGEAIARAIGKSVNTTNTYRTRLKNMGVIAASGRGGLVFTIPYLPRYLEEGSADPWESADDGTPYVMS